MARTFQVVVAALIVLGAVPTPGPAEAGDARTITMRDNHFLPSAAVVAQGQPVEFQNFGMVAHDAYDGSGLDLFATDVLGAADTEVVGPLPGSGTYRYYCSFHPEMVGRFQVPVTLSRSQSPAGSPVTVRWSNRRAPSGLVYDVQRRRPGDGRFADWRSEATASGARFWPVARGSWQIRARVRAAGGVEDSDWSPAVTLRVT